MEMEAVMSHQDLARGRAGSWMRGHYRRSSAGEVSRAIPFQWHAVYVHASQCDAFHRPFIKDMTMKIG